jgi:hypothetical protein
VLDRVSELCADSTTVVEESGSDDGAAQREDSTIRLALTARKYLACRMLRYHRKRLSKHLSGMQLIRGTMNMSPSWPGIYTYRRYEHLRLRVYSLLELHR